MLTKLVTSYFESDDNSFRLEGYNLSHRFNPLVGLKFKVEDIKKVTDPSSGRNLDQITLKFYDDSFFVNVVDAQMRLEISRLKHDLEESYKTNKRQLEEMTRERVRSANEKAELARQRIKEVQEQASQKVELAEGKVESKTEETIQRLEKEYRNKLKVSDELNQMEKNQLIKRIDELEKQLMKAQEKASTVVPVKRRSRKSS